MDRLDEWRIFVAVATRRSFAATARALGRSPQVITRAVAALEQRLGTRLLARTTRSVSLTDDGARYLDDARRVLGDFDALEASAADRGELRGAVTIAAPVLFGQLHVAPIVHRFVAEHAAVDARLLFHDRVVSLADEGVDVSVRIGTLPDSSLRARAVGHVRTVVCASPAYLERRGWPRDPDALAKHDVIAFSGTSPLLDRWSFAVDGRRDRSVAVRPRLSVNTGQAAIDAALAGLGITRVLSYQVDTLVAAGQLRLLLRRFDPPPVPIHVLQLPGVQRRAAAAFADLATERLRQRFA
jgi:DNA-binding transcriptional LysR family regulator